MSDAPPLDKKLSAAEKRRYALELRIAGADYDQIAKLVGWRSKSSAWEAVDRALRELEKESAEQVRELELARLDKLLARWWPRALERDKDAVDRVLAIQRQRLRLLPGLEAPSKTEHTGPSGAPLTVEFLVPPSVTVDAVPEDELNRTPEAAADVEA